MTCFLIMLPVIIRGELTLDIKGGAESATPQCHGFKIVDAKHRPSGSGETEILQFSWSNVRLM